MSDVRDLPDDSEYKPRPDEGSSSGSSTVQSQPDLSKSENEPSMEEQRKELARLREARRQEKEDNAKLREARKQERNQQLTADYKKEQAGREEEKQQNKQKPKRQLLALLPDEEEQLHHVLESSGITVGPIYLALIASRP